jgi:putative hydrolase of the HAD superfamily
MQNIRNIIFDLGGVILNIDFKLTEKALKELGIDNFSEYMTQQHISSFFKEYEIGKIDDASFVRALQSLASKPLAEDAIINAWNALLADFPRERIELLQRLKTNYRLFLLSNTNSIHYKEFQRKLRLQTGNYLEDYFEKTYYSHEVGLSKPSIEIFQLVISENKLDPSQTLFIDDTEGNIVAAKQAGLQTHHIVPGTSITELEW